MTPAWRSVPEPTRAAPLRALDSWVDDGPGTARGRLVVTADLPGLAGHFPGRPILPGIYLLEAALQLLDVARPEQPLRSVERLRFVRAVVPGEQVELSAASGRDPTEVKVSVRTVDGEPVASISLRTGCAGPAPAVSRPVCISAGPALAPLELLPQRWPLLLVDEVCGHQPGVALCARKTVTLADPAYAAAAGDWTGTQLRYPTSLLLESFGQAAAMLAMGASHQVQPGEVLMLAATRGFTPYAVVGPGAVLHHVVTLERADAATMVAGGVIWACDTLVATVDQLIAVRRQER